MIRSLPKPLQNDFDTIVLDILSRYSLDNKLVKRFVEDVAQQVRDLNGLPRFMKDAKPSRGTKPQDKTETEESTSAKEKPGVLSRLEGYQSAWNRASLVGVFLEYLKNRKEDQQAKLVQSDQKSATNATKEKNDQPPIAQTVKSEKQIIERFTDKITESKTDILEKVVNNLQKIQEVFSSPGLLGATKSILSAFEKPESIKPATPFVSSTSYTAPTYDSATNASTINTTNTAVTNNESIELAQEEVRAQKQDLLKEEQVIILGGINDKGARDLRKILESIFEEQSNIFAKTTMPANMESLMTESAYDGPGILEAWLASRGLTSMFGGRGGKSLGGGKGGARARARARAQGRGYQSPKPGQKPPTSKPTTPAPKPTTKPGRFIPKPGVGGFLRGIGTLGLGMLADWGGQMAGGEIAKDIYGEEKTAAAYEEYGADVFGLFGASYDATKAIGEAKEARERLEKQEKQTIPLDIKAMMYGYKDLADFGEAVSSGKENRRMYWDDQKQAVVVIQPDKTQEIHKFIYGKGFQGKPEIVGPDGKSVTTISDTSNSAIEKPLPTQNPDVIPLPPNTPKVDIEKPPTPIIPQTTSVNQSTALTSNTVNNQSGSPVFNSSSLTGSAFSLTPDPTISSSPAQPSAPNLFNAVSTPSLLPTVINNTNNSTSSITPDTTKISPPVPPSVTENHVTNNTADKKVLTDIANNTEKTNKSLTSLSDAVFKLAQVFDSKTTNTGGNVIINSNGQAQQYTSTSQMASNNVDTTRIIRQQFLAAIG